MVFTLILLVIFNSNYWLYLIIIFYVYDSKIHFIYAIPFIFRFLVLVVTSSHPVKVSFFLPEQLHHFTVTVVDCYLLVVFLVSSLSMSVTTCLDRFLNPNYFFEQQYCHHIPPWKSASGIVLCSGNKVINCDLSCSGTAPLYSLLAAGVPTVKNLTGSIIRHHHHEGSARRREHPRNIEYTLLWPSAVRFSSMPQRLGNRGISLINSSALTQVLGVEGNS